MRPSAPDRGAIGFWELAWTTSWIFHFVLVPSALLYAVGQAFHAARTLAGSSTMPQTPSARASSPPPVRSTLGQHFVSGFVRLTLFAVVGIGGWLTGGTIGGFVGAGLDLLFVGDKPPAFGVIVAPSFWTLGWLGAIAGMVGSVSWVASRMDRNETYPVD